MNTGVVVGLVALAVVGIGVGIAVSSAGKKSAKPPGPKPEPKLEPKPEPPGPEPEPDKPPMPLEKALHGGYTAAVLTDVPSNEAAPMIVYLHPEATSPFTPELVSYPGSRNVYIRARRKMGNNRYSYDLYDPDASLESARLGQALQDLTVSLEDLTATFPTSRVVVVAEVKGSSLAYLLAARGLVDAVVVLDFDMLNKAFDDKHFNHEWDALELLSQDPPVPYPVRFYGLVENNPAILQSWVDLLPKGVLEEVIQLPQVDFVERMTDKFLAELRLLVDEMVFKALAG